MKDIVVCLAAGLISGVVGGLGIGGGTVLIPALTLFLPVSQHEAQAINLVAFVPMATVSLVFHFRNGLVKTDGLLPLVVSAAACAALFCLVAAKVDGGAMRRLFGWFLICVSAWCFVRSFSMPKERRGTQ